MGTEVKIGGKDYFGLKFSGVVKAGGNGDLSIVFDQSATEKPEEGKLESSVSIDFLENAEEAPAEEGPREGAKVHGVYNFVENLPRAVAWEFSDNEIS